MRRELPTNRPEVWASPAWKTAAVAWLDEQLSAAGIDRTGEVDQPHLRPWATVLRAPTTAGLVWLKAAGPGTAFEAELYQLLSQVVPIVCSHRSLPIRRGGGSCCRTVVRRLAIASTAPS